jgi:spore maturation protein CgeB
MIKVFRRTGCRVEVLDRHAQAFAESLHARLAASPCDAVFTLNFHPLVAEICHRNHVPFVAWNIDNLARSDFCDPRFAFPETLLFLIDKPSLDIYRSKGYPHVFYLPIGTNLQHFKPAEPDSGEAPRPPYSISFVGCSMVRQGNEFPGVINSLQQRAARAQNELDRVMYTRVRQMLERIVEEECNRFFQPGLHGQLQQASRLLRFNMARVLWPDPDFFHIIPAKEISSRKRLALVRQLSEVSTVDLFGDEGWQVLAGRRIRCHGPADYARQTPRIYQQSRINLNIEKIYNTASLNLRIIDAMACGGFVLTEPVDDLKDYFSDGRELAVYGSAEELREKAGYYLAHEQERRAVAARGMQTVRAQFSLEGRIQEMMQTVERYATAGGDCAA